MMPIIRIVRLEENLMYGTFGILVFHTEVFCWTLEPPDQLNQRNISSIPAQQYMCHKIISPKYNETFQIMDVPLRDHVLFHAGNVVEHTRGCVILGQSQGKLKGDRAILNSGNTYKMFMQKLKDYQNFHLTIKEAY